MEREPQEETYPREASGWVDWAQAAMETELAGAQPRCCLLICLLWEIRARETQEQNREAHAEWG